MHRIGALVGSLLLALTPHAAADHLEPLSPPMAFTATYNHTSQEIHFEWEPPAHGAASSYNLYENGDLVASTPATNYTIALDPGGTATGVLLMFYVSPQFADVEGLPTKPMLAWRSPPDDITPPECGLIIFFIDPDETPPVDWVVNDACKDGWERYIEHLLEEAAGTVLQASPIHSEG